MPGELTVDDCRRMFRDFAATTASRAPLYARLSTGIAADADLAALMLLAPPTQRQPVLLFASLHALLLAEPSQELARWYPDLTETPETAADPMPALRRLCAARADQLAAMLATRTTQTNEIGRCAVFLPVFGLLAAEVAGPLAHVDVGTSAGLNLLLTRYRYRYEPTDRIVGDPDASVELVCGTRGDVPVPATMPPVARSVGLDRSPVDVDDDAAVRWLEACVWPDQIDRLRRLRAAIALARGTGLDVRRGDALADTAALVTEVAASGHPVVTNSWVLNYLTGEQRAAYVDALDATGARQDLSWVYAESPWMTPELPGPVGDAETERTVVVLVRWRDGIRHAEHLADMHPHGYWLHWH